MHRTKLYGMARCMGSWTAHYGFVQTGQHTRRSCGTCCCCNPYRTVQNDTGTGACASSHASFIPVLPAALQVSAVLEAGVLLLYLGGLLVLLAFGTFLVVRQVLVRRDLELAAKELQV